jgi:hypothetical protein
MYDKELAAKFADMLAKIAEMREEIDQLYSFHGRQPLRMQRAQAAKAGRAKA